MKDIKIVDPAVGSGAFPIGMMNEIVKARSITSLVSGEEKSVYDLKRETIENCLYGVDIDSSAVDIAKLRFWLSLIVDELDMQNIKPLPNLDHKIMCGDSLLEEFEGIKLFDDRMLGETKKDNDLEEQQTKKKIKELKLELGEIMLGKKKDSGRLKEVKKELKSLEKRLKNLKESPEEETQQQTLNNALNKRIKESQKKLSELRKLQKDFFSEQNRKRKKEQANQINHLEWELIEETLKEQSNEEAIKKLKQYKKNKSKPFFIWKLYFPEVFQRKNPGFDIVIANPPYFPITNLAKDIKKILFDKNPEIAGSFAGKTDVYLFFILKSLKQLIRKNGQLSYIIPKTILSNMSFSKLREVMLNKYRINELVDLEKVFEQVTGTMTYLLLFVKNEIPKNEYDLEINNMSIDGSVESSVINITDLNRPPFYIWVLSKNKIMLLNKIEKNSDLLGKDYITKNGVCTGKNSKFLSNKRINQYYKPIFVAKDISKYHLKKPKNYIYFKPKLLHRPRAPWIFKSPKILSQMIRGLNTTYRLICALDYSNNLALNNSNIIRKKNESSDLELLLGLINSKLLNFYFKNLITDVNIKTVYLDILPIKKENPKIKNSIKKLVYQILKISNASDYIDNSNKQAKIKKLETAIDQLVYKLYDLTSDEIKVIEKANNKNS